PAGPETAGGAMPGPSLSSDGKAARALHARRAALERNAYHRAPPVDGLSAVRRGDPRAVAPWKPAQRREASALTSGSRHRIEVKPERSLRKNIAIGWAT